MGEHTCAASRATESRPPLRSLGDGSEDRSCRKNGEHRGKPRPCIISKSAVTFPPIYKSGLRLRAHGVRIPSGLKETSYVDGQNVSSFAGRAGNTTECRRWWLSWFVVRWL